MSELTFRHRPAVQIVAVDGSWSRNCSMIDISPTGTTLSVEGSIEGLNLGEFVLRLSSTGAAHRRCAIVNIVGSELGARFLDRKKQNENAPTKARS